MDIVSSRREGLWKDEDMVSRLHRNNTRSSVQGLTSGKRPCTKGGRAGRGKLLSFLYMDLQLCSLVFFIFFFSQLYLVLIGPAPKRPCTYQTF